MLRKLIDQEANYQEGENELYNLEGKAKPYKPGLLRSLIDVLIDVKCSIHGVIGTVKLGDADQVVSDHRKDCNGV